MRLILVRHGETQWNNDYRIQGVSDIALNDRGERQAKLVAKRLSNEKIAAIYTSPLKRALATASAIAKYHRLTVATRDGLKELCHGVLEGKTAEEAHRDHGPLVDQWRQDPVNIRVPGGESLLELQARAWKVIEEITERHQGDHVVAVSHHNTIITILCRFLGLDLSNYRRLRVELGSISIIDEGAWGPIITALNDTHHLSSDGTPTRTLARLLP